MRPADHCGRIPQDDEITKESEGLTSAQSLVNCNHDMKLQRNRVTKRSKSYIGTLKNTKEAHEIVRCLSTLYRPYGSVYKQGRNPHRKALAVTLGRSHEDLRRNVPISHSTRFDVYLNSKDWNTTVKGLPPFWRFPLGILKVMVMLKNS